jgi:hydroxyacylglutathione hydrolase
MVSTNAVHATKSDVIVVQLPCLDDNYGYIIHDPATGDTGVVDTPDAKRYEEELKRRGWTLTHILNTHHHWDHTGGNLELKQSNANVHVYGPALEKEKIPGIDTALSGNDDMKFGSTQATILQVSGHTNGHIAYYFPKEGIVFTGDALFALGCGRMFEGTPPMFWSSLKTLRELPDDTIVYCAHEYTLSNAKFAMSVEPNNQLLASRNEEIKIKRANNEFTVPSQLGLEKKTNPFLRIDVSDEIRRNVGAVETDTDEAIFAKVRKAKDNFRG